MRRIYGQFWWRGGVPVLVFARGRMAFIYLSCAQMKQMSRLGRHGLFCFVSCEFSAGRGSQATLAAAAAFALQCALQCETVWAAQCARSGAQRSMATWERKQES